MDKFCEDCIHNLVCQYGACCPSGHCNDKDTLDDLRLYGKWITVKQDTILGNFEVKNKVCDQCNHATKYEYPFCPWCGADMRKDEEDG